MTFLEANLRNDKKKTYNHFHVKNALTIPGFHNQGSFIKTERILTEFSNGVADQIIIY